MGEASGCTTLDHVFPSNGIKTVPGTPCYCGAKTWADAPRSARTLRQGQPVTVEGESRVILEKMRGEDVYRLDAAVHGRTLFERDELSAA